jgi:hypothetical protein
VAQEFRLRVVADAFEEDLPDLLACPRGSAPSEIFTPHQMPRQTPRQTPPLNPRLSAACSGATDGGFRSSTVSSTGYVRPTASLICFSMT